MGRYKKTVWSQLNATQRAELRDKILKVNPNITLEEIVDNVHYGLLKNNQLVAVQITYREQHEQTVKICEHCNQIIKNEK